jgi:hypothetical protein
VLDRKWPADGIGPVATLVAQLPDPAELPAGSVLVVRQMQKPRGGLRGLIDHAVALVRRRRKAHVAVRCTALLARGYRDIGSSTDPKTGEELAWGLAPHREAMASDVTFGRSS